MKKYLVEIIGVGILALVFGALMYGYTHRHDEYNELMRDCVKEHSLEDCKIRTETLLRLRHLY